MDQSERLRNERIPRLLMSLAAPAICAQVVSLLYNLVDRIYIGQMLDGTLAMASVGICAPMVTIVTGFTGLLGRGGAPLAAIRLGEDDKEKAQKYLGTSFSTLVISSILIIVITLLFKEPLLYLFWASSDTYYYADEYMTTYILGTVFVQLTVGMNYYITTQGFAKTAMVTTMLGAIINIILDPIFIFMMNMGVRGAALATVISQFASFIWVMYFIFSKRNNLRLKKDNLIPNIKILKEITLLGASPFFMNVSEGALNISFNNQVKYFGGDIALSAMTVLFSVFQIVHMPLEGVSQGSQPIISYNYGAKRYDRVRETIKLAFIINTVFASIAMLIIELFPHFFISIFNSDTELIKVAEPMLQIYVFGLFMMGPNSTLQQTYNSLNEGKKSFFFAFLRKIILLIPLIYILPSILPLGVLAVVLAEPISDIITSLSNIIYFKKFINQKIPTNNI